MVEAVIALQVFIVIVLLAIDLSIITYRSAALHYTLSEGIRWASVNHDDGANSRLQSIESHIVQIGSVYGLKLTSSDIRVCAAGETDCSSIEEQSFNGGDSREFLQISANLPQQVFLGTYTVDLKASVIGKNEPFF